MLITRISRKQLSSIIDRWHGSCHDQAFHAENRFQSQVTPCRIYSGQSGNGSSLSHIISVFFLVTIIPPILSINISFIYHQRYTRWFKYDRDDLCVNKSQFVPVIFEPTLYILSKWKHRNIPPKYRRPAWPNTNWPTGKNRRISFT
jgi:hypothetical protein